MPASSPLTIATNAVTRLLKEQEYYRKDYAAQQKKLDELKTSTSAGDDASNDGFLLKQRETALSETETVLKQTPDNVRTAMEKLENLLRKSKRSSVRIYEVSLLTVEKAGTEQQEGAEVEKAKEAVAQANDALKA